jgi:DNA ligase-1
MPKAKRDKVGQTRLEQYFSGPPNKIHAIQEASCVGTAPDPLAMAGPSGSTTSSTFNEVIDVDALDLGSTSRKAESPTPSLKPSSGHSSTKLIGFTVKESATNKSHNLCLSEDPLQFSTGNKPWSTAYAPYSFLAQVFTVLSETRSRNIILNTLTNALRIIIMHDWASLVPSLYLLSNTLSPPYIPIELGLGPSIITKAIQHVSGLTPMALKRLYNSAGDLGDVAFVAKSQVRTLVPHAPLFISGVYDILLKIADVKGNGAAKQKQALVEKLLVSAKGEEIRYLVRTLSMNLRVGAVRTSILTALARATVLSPGPEGSTLHVSASLIAKAEALPTNNKGKATLPARGEILAKFSTADTMLKKVFVLHPNYDDIAKELLEGLDGLETRVHLSIGMCCSRPS